MSFSLHWKPTDLSKLGVLPKAVEEFNALNKVLTNNVFNFQALEPPLHTFPALLNLGSPSGRSPLSFSYC